MIRDWNDPKYCLKAVKIDGLALRCVINQTHEICLEAVKQDGYSLKFVKEQTPESCLEAIKQNGLALRFVKDQTPLIVHYLKKYNITIHNAFKKSNHITISDKEIKKFYNENPHLLLTL